ncbi:MAG: hypothetical protein GY910_26755 [bacterium]|nr:hypothetical protein [bacterium]
MDRRVHVDRIAPESAAVLVSAPIEGVAFEIIRGGPDLRRPVAIVALSR